MLLKKFLRPLANSKIGLFLREKSGFRPPVFLFGNETSFISSDLFFWRTDNGYSTIFKASDILSKYYDVESSLTLIFYDSDGSFLLQKTVEFHYNFATLTITSTLLAKEGMGTFIALNIPREPLRSAVQVTNRCYVGYGKDGSHSMVHGNFTAIKAKPNAENFNPFRDIKPAISSQKGDFLYYLQKPNYSFLKISLVFANPLDRKIVININKKRYELNRRSCILVLVPKSDESILIESDFIWPRPLVFCEKGTFIDVHHG